ncbi:MAG: hypothetical protein Q4E46_01785 [Candidatus Saccharibacteria bacterium]|nr:hypothetical protein [Candidatus Saccharibacteria bacterium]
MVLNVKKKYYERVMTGDYDVQIVARQANATPPGVGEILYYNNCNVGFRINCVRELWSVQDLESPWLLSRAVMNAPARMALDAIMKPDMAQHVRLYALLLQPENDGLINLRNQEHTVVGRYNNGQLGTGSCQNFMMIGTLSAMLRAYHPELSADDIGRLTAGIFNGDYFAIIGSLSSSYANQHYTGYAIFSEGGSILSEGQLAHLSNRPIPQNVLSECSLICNDDGSYRETFKAGVKRRLRGCIWQLTGILPAGVIDIE